MLLGPKERKKETIMRIYDSEDKNSEACDFEKMTLGSISRGNESKVIYMRK